MKNPVSRPERVALADLDDAIKASVERAEQATELSKDALESTNGGVAIGRTPGLISPINVQ